MSERPSDRLQPSGKRRPGQQLTKDDFEDDSDDGAAVDPGTWGKADAATMARRKVVKVRRGGAAVAADQPTPAAAEPDAKDASNPFAGVIMTPAAAPTGNPFGGISLAAATAGQAPADASKAGEQQAADNSKPAAEAAPAADTDKQPEKQAAVQDKAEAQPAAAAPPAPAAEKQKADAQEEQQPQQQQGDSKASKPAADKADDKPAAAPAAGTSGGFGALGASSTGGFGGFGGFAASTGGFGGFGSCAGGFWGLAAAAKDSTGAGGSLFAGFTAPQPGSTFGGFGGSSGGSKASKDGEEGGEGEDGAGGEENGQELFGGQDVAPVVQLSEVPKQTGEEEENSVFTADGKLYEFVDGAWKERGRGDMRVNVHRSTHKARLVMRQKGSQRLLLNAGLYPKIPTSVMLGGKGATFAVVNAAPQGEGAQKEGAGADAGDAAAASSAGAGAGAGSMKTYAFKTKTAGETSKFIEAMDKFKDGATPAADAAADGGAPANPDAWA